MRSGSWALRLWCFGLVLLASSSAMAAPAFPVDPTCAFSDRYPVDISVLGQEQARQVVDLGIDVDQILLPEGPAMPGTVRAYIDDQESARLQAAGFEVTPVRNLAKEMFLEVKKQWDQEETQRQAGGHPQPHFTNWPSYTDLQADLQAVAAAHPDICQLTSIGTSVQGRSLWIMKISDHVGIHEFEPEFKFTSTIHGDEPPGMEMCRRMIHYLTDNYGIDPTVTNLVNSAELWFLPLSNPDGYVNGTRYNYHGVDLNRNFPDPITDPNDNPSGREPETQAHMYFGYAHTFILSANYHSGSLVLNLPWDCQYTLPPDNDLIWSIADGYSVLNPPMWNGDGGIGVHGVINGAQWYIVHGGMQDWCYNWRNEMDITAEIDQTKWPAYSAMDACWSDNRDAMLWYMGRTLQGGMVEGIVTNASNGQPLLAEVNVVEIGKHIYTDSGLGDYHRLLLPGTYTMTFAADNFQTKTISKVVATSGAPTELNVALQPIPSGVDGRGLAEGPAALELSAPAPNPLGVVAGPIRASLRVASAGTVMAGVYDISGRLVRTLASGPMTAGAHEIQWDGRTDAGARAASGVYALRVQAGKAEASRRVVVL